MGSQKYFKELLLLKKSAELLTLRRRFRALDKPKSSLKFPGNPFNMCIPKVRGNPEEYPSTHSFKYNQTILEKPPEAVKPDCLEI